MGALVTHTGDHRSWLLMVLYTSFSIYLAVGLSQILNNAEHSQLVGVSNLQLAAPILVFLSAWPPCGFCLETGAQSWDRSHTSAPILVL
jgi:hypothetical protein